jgi:hypothetical protein
MSEHLLLVRGTHWDKVLSLEETQKILSRANAWFDRLIQQSKAKGGQRLAPEGQIVSGDKGKTVTDGPFAESKEAIAGYVLLEADNLNEAVEIAKGSPLLEIHAVKSRSPPSGAIIRLEIAKVGGTRVEAWQSAPTSARGTSFLDNSTNEQPRNHFQYQPLGTTENLGWFYLQDQPHCNFRLPIPAWARPVTEDLAQD